MRPATGRGTRVGESWSRALDDLDAVIFDTDGVITDTAALHAKAWKQLFDEYLRVRAAGNGGPFVPFDIDSDYRRYVDGKPRYDGVRSFLASRGIELPEGDPSDPPDRETICGLGNRKNEAFRDRLHQERARAYPSTIDLVEQLRADGVAVAAISASENMDEVLASAGLISLFDATVDGVDAARLALPGKPDPAVFVEAARRLGIAPARAAVVEDALAGVEAGRRGSFGLVVGVDRTGHPNALLEAGADVVVSDLRELQRPAAGPTPSPHTPIRALPSALEAEAELGLRLSAGRPAVFLDYDGTLTPIVARPSDARLPVAARAALIDLAARAPLAIISGRDLGDVKSLVDIPGIWYAGSHGFEIESPTGERYERAPRSASTLETAATALGGAIKNVQGAWVERKAFALAVHVRQTPPDRVADVAEAVRQVAADHPGLRMTGGKRVFELRPALSWDKGRAVRRLLDVMALEPPTVPIYVGDDLTDEDAFYAIREDGIGVVVRGESDDRGTWAAFALAGPDDVPTLLRFVLEAATP